jgi:hypothetical protein
MLRRMKRLIGASVVAFVLTIAATGTASAQGQVLPLPAADQQRMNALLGASVIGKALPSGPIDEPMRYFPLTEKSPSYTVTSGPNAGKTQVLKVAKGQRPGGNDAWRFGLSSTLAAFLRNVDGNLMMPAVTDTYEGVVVITTPPNPFLLKGMKPGETRNFAQKVSVNSRPAWAWSR